jgi:DNA-binding CsgD family transcriptional regulator
MDQPSRLQTMRNAIAWSDDLLTPDAQAIFRRVATFTGGFSLEAAEQVGSVESNAAAHTSDPIVFDGLATLIDASLLRTEIRAGGVTRFRMLETIREYALEQLAASNETVSVRNAHAAHFTALARQYEHADLHPDGNQAVAKLDTEHANFRAALAWLEESEQDDAFSRLATSLGRFWSGQGHYQEGRVWLTRAVANESPQAMSDRAKALVSLGMIELFQGAHREGEICLTEGLARCREQGHHFHAANALVGLGGMATLHGNLDQGASYLHEAIATSRAVEDQRMAEIMAGWALINLAVVARTRGDFTLAAEQLEEALGLVREAKYVTGTILALGDRGDLARDIGDHRRALGLYQEALGLARDNPGTREARDVVEAVAIASIAIGQAEHGARLLGATEAMRERMGLQYRVTETEVALEQAVSAAQVALGNAAFTAAWSAGRSLQPSQAVAEALEPIAPSFVGVGNSLTPREREVLILLAGGMTDPAIADELFLSVRTVENHVSHILAKIGVHTRTAAASAAIADGLVAAGTHPPS